MAMCLALPCDSSALVAVGGPPGSIAGANMSNFAEVYGY